MSTHTPTPWTAGGITGYGVYDQHGWAIALPLEAYPMRPRAELVANAEHIVRCVNAHDALVESLQGIIDRWSKYPKKPTGDDLKIYLDIARSALALVQS